MFTEEKPKRRVRNKKTAKAPAWLVRLVGAVFIIFLLTLAQKVASNGAALDRLETQQAEVVYPQDMEAEGVILNTAAPYMPTATVDVYDPTIEPPLLLNFQEFTATKYEVKARPGASAMAQCPYRWVSVKDAPNGNIIGCLTPYSVWNIDTVIDQQESLYRENGNVWAILSGQPGHWVALATTNPSTGMVTYYFNWNGK